MDNLIFCLNATVPIFFLMILGMAFRKMGLITKPLSVGLNSLVFKVAIPVLLFKDMAETDFGAGFDWKFIILCLTATALSIGIAAAMSMIFAKSDFRAEFVQASYRSSASLLGIAFIKSLYGSSKMAPLMVLGSVPLYNIAAVLILTLWGPEEEGEKRKIDGHFFAELGRGIITNPIILGIVGGSMWAFVKLPIPVIMGKTMNYLAALATPLGLMSMGASFDVSEALGELKPAVAASVLKLVVFAAIFLPIAVAVGFRRDQLVSFLVMTASPTTVSCFVMAKNMGHKGTLTASVTLLTTFAGAFTLTGWLFVLKFMGLV